jgi:hypothetical protein
MPSKPRSLKAALGGPFTREKVSQLLLECMKNSSAKMPKPLAIEILAFQLNLTWRWVQTWLGPEQDVLEAIDKAMRFLIEVLPLQ